jgi:hypothetical protein
MADAGDFGQIEFPVYWEVIVSNRADAERQVVVEWITPDYPAKNTKVTAPKAGTKLSPTTTSPCRQTLTRAEPSHPKAGEIGVWLPIGTYRIGKHGICCVEVKGLGVGLEREINLDLIPSAGGFSPDFTPLDDGSPSGELPSIETMSEALNNLIARMLVEDGSAIKNVSYQEGDVSTVIENCKVTEYITDVKVDGKFKRMLIASITDPLGAYFKSTATFTEVAREEQTFSVGEGVFVSNATEMLFTSEDNSRSIKFIIKPPLTPQAG